jgi:hypothetical protein
MISFRESSPSELLMQIIASRGRGALGKDGRLKLRYGGHRRYESFSSCAARSWPSFALLAPTL